MSSSAAFFFNGDRIVYIANAADAGPPYRAGRRLLPPGTTVPARAEASAETTIVVVDGIIELMVGGAAGMMGPGGFARIPPGTQFAYRNAGDGCAELLVRIAPVGTPRPSCRVTIDIAAA
jgi:quercetin dioxygenase-like cupin family protein